MRSFCQTCFGTIRCYCFINYFCVTKCWDNRLRYKHCATLRTVRTFCQTSFGTCWCYCIIIYYIVTCCWDRFCVGVTANYAIDISCTCVSSYACGCTSCWCRYYACIVAMTKCIFGLYGHGSSTFSNTITTCVQTVVNCVTFGCTCCWYSCCGCHIALLVNVVGCCCFHICGTLANQVFVLGFFHITGFVELCGVDHRARTHI